MVKISATDCKLILGVDSNQTQVSILDRFMGEVLPDVDVLGTLSASDNVVAPLNTSVIVLIDWGPGLWRKTHALQEVSEINHLNSRRGC